MILVFNKKAYKLESKLIETSINNVDESKIINEITGEEEVIKQVARFEIIHDTVAKNVTIGDVILIRGNTVIRYDPFINVMAELGKLDIKLGMQLLVHNSITVDINTLVIKEMLFNITSMEYINISLNNIKIGGNRNV